MSWVPAEGRHFRKGVLTPGGVAAAGWLRGGCWGRFGWRAERILRGRPTTTTQACPSSYAGSPHWIVKSALSNTIFCSRFMIFFYFTGEGTWITESTEDQTFGVQIKNSLCVVEKIYECSELEASWLNTRFLFCKCFFSCTPVTSLPWWRKLKKKAEQQ